MKESAKQFMINNILAYVESTKEQHTNCPNCGAPLKDSKCEYCGTEKSK